MQLFPVLVSAVVLVLFRPQCLQTAVVNYFHHRDGLAGDFPTADVVVSTIFNTKTRLSLHQMRTVR